MSERDSAIPEDHITKTIVALSENGNRRSANEAANDVAEGPRSSAKIEEGEKSASDSLIEALRKLIAEENQKPQPDSFNTSNAIKPIQYAGLILFCLNVSIFYLTVKSLFPMVIKAPFWQLVGQVVSIAVGG